MKINWTEPAINDLDNIYEYIARDSKYYAKSFTGKIFNYVEHLQDNPKIGRVVPEANERQIRKIIFQKYRIIYRLHIDSIQKITIVHSSRDIEAKKLKPWEFT